MKKLNLNDVAFPKGELMTRGQLKKVLGGSGSTGKCPDECNHDTQCITILNTPGAKCKSTLCEEDQYASHYMACYES